MEPKFIKIEFKMENREVGFIITWKYNGELMNEQSELKFIIYKKGKQIIRTSKINNSALYFT